MSPMRGMALEVCRRALENGIIPPEQHERVRALLESFPSDRTEPQVLVEHGILTQDQLAQLLPESAVSCGPERPPAASSEAITRHQPDEAQQVALSLPSPAGFPRPFGDDYELLALIGQGGMGEVYKARQKSLRRHVALKLIKPSGIITEEAIKRFHIEAQAAARLSHPNIVSVHHVGIHEGQHFLTMDLVDGSSLSSVLREGGLLLAQRLGLLEKVARAIHHAHTEGIVHRDLKPGNILIDRSGEPLVTDFGLAKDFEADFSLSISSAIMGTPSYMSPEQALGHSKQADARSDVYSLGAILYEMLVGHPPFQAGNLAELLRMIVEEDAVSPRRLNRAVSPDAETICLKALTKDPTRRYQTASELADDLRRFLAGEPIEARPSSVFYRAKKHILRNKALAAVGALALVVALGLLTGWILTLRQRTGQAIRAQRAAEGAGAEAQRQERQAEEQRKLAEERETTTRRYLYAERMRTIREAWGRHDTTAVIRLLDGLRPQPGQLDVRGWEWHRYWRLCHSQIITLSGHKGPVGCVAFSPDGKTVATASGDKTVKLWDAANGKTLRTLEGHTKPVNFVFLRPGGSELLTGARNESARLWNLDSGADALLFRGEINSMALSPDGRFLADGGHTARYLRIWNLDERKVAIDMGAYPDYVQSLAFSPDGKTLAIGLGWALESGEVRLLDLASRKEVKTFGGFTSGVFGLAFSPDGNRLAARSLTRIRVWDLAKGEELPGKDVEYIGRVGAIAFSPDSRLLAAGSGNRLEAWEVPAWKKVASFVGHTGNVISVAFAPNGGMLASGSDDGSARLWRMDTSSAPAEEGTIVKGVKRSWFRSIAFSPDSSLMATACGDDTVKLWDPATGAELAVLRDHSDTVNSVAFSPDGKTLATASNDRTARLWDLATRSVKHTLTQMGGVCQASFFPGRELLATTGYLNELRLWDTATGRQVQYREAKGYGTALAFSHDGKFAAVCLWNATKPGVVRLWDLTKDEAVSLEGHTGMIRAIAFAPDGTTLATGSDDSTVRFWDLRTRQEQTSQRRRMTGAVLSVIFSPDSAYAIACGHHYADRELVGTGAFHIFRVTKTNPPAGKQGLVPGRDRRILAHSRSVGALAMSPDGKLLASGSEDGTLKLWRTSTWETVTTLPAHAGGVTSVAFSPDGKQLVAGGNDFAVRLYDRGTRREIKALRGHTDIVNCVAFSPDGALVASGGYDKVVRVWDLATGRPRAELPGHTLPVRCVAFSPDGKSLVSGDGCYDAGGATVRVWDLATGKARAIPLAHTQIATCALFLPDGQSLVVALSSQYEEWRTMKVWATSSEQERPPFAGHKDAVHAMALSPDGKTLATGGSDNSVKLWDVATRKELATLVGHAGSVYGVAFARDGKTLVSASADKTLRVWDPILCETRATLEAHDAAVRCLASSPDGQALATVGADGSLKLWRTSTERWEAEPPDSPPGKSVAK